MRSLRRPPHQGRGAPEGTAWAPPHRVRTGMLLHERVMFTFQREKKRKKKNCEISLSPETPRPKSRKTTAQTHRYRKAYVRTYEHGTVRWRHVRCQHVTFHRTTIVPYGTYLARKSMLKYRTQYVRTQYRQLPQKKNTQYFTKSRNSAPQKPKSIKNTQNTTTQNTSKN